MPVAGITYFPPARRGDVASAAFAFDAILLIDGLFHHSLAVSPKEAYDACLRTRFFGASSLGALRAVECAPYGAQPLGAIAGWFRAGRIDGDDEVAVLEDASEHRALTAPLVNIRFVARLAVHRSILSADEAAAWTARAREIFYADRTWKASIEEAPRRTQPRLMELAAQYDLKEMDAQFALRTVCRKLGLRHRV